MTHAPAVDQRRLLDVQALDTRLAQLGHQRRSHPTIGALAELEARLADLARAEIDARTSVKDIGRELTKAETDVEQVRTRADRDQARLDSGAVSAKDAVALTDELQSLAKRQSDLEEIELEVMERLEAAEAALAAIGEQKVALEADVARTLTERDEAFSALDADAADVTARRAVAADGIDAGLLALYDKVRLANSGLAVLSLRGTRTDPLHLDLSLSEVATIKAAAPELVVRSEEDGYILVRLEPGE